MVDDGIWTEDKSCAGQSHSAAAYEDIAGVVSASSGREVVATAVKRTSYVSANSSASSLVHTPSLRADKL